MKFQLIMVLCSVVYGECKPPETHPLLFNSHYECASAGYLNSHKILQDYGSTFVNDARLQISFTCKELIMS